MFNTLRTDLRLSTAEGTANNVMVGVGETYLPAFVLRADRQPTGVRAGEHAAAGRRRVDATGVALAVDEMRIVPAVGCDLRGGGAGSDVRAAARCRVYRPHELRRRLRLGGASTGRLAWARPALERLDRDARARGVRIRYFARRTRINQWGIVAGFLAGGVALQVAARLSIPLAVFAVLFFLAAASRIVSFGLLTMHREPQPPRRARPCRWRASSVH